MGIFDKKGYVTRKELRTALGKAAFKSPRYTRKQGVAMEKELFAPKYGSQISQKDLKIRLEKMRRERFGKSFAERRVIERKMNLLKNIK